MTSLDDIAIPSESGRPWLQVCCTGCLLLGIAVVIALSVFTNLIPGPLKLAADHIRDLTKQYRL